MKLIDGGVCAPSGFKASGIHCGVRPNKDKNDLALIVSEYPCVSSAMFTSNVVKAAPVKLDIITAKKGKARAIVANSGIANACCPDEEMTASSMQKCAADVLGIDPDEVFVCSTGVIGQRLNIEAIRNGLPLCAEQLECSAGASDNAARAIMTTDTRKKEFAVEFELSDGTVSRLGGISKGSGMIHPNMGTMLCFITGDANISRELSDRALRKVCAGSFNRISVDGDTSTNDTLLLLTNGACGNKLIDSDDADYKAFVDALEFLCVSLAKAMAADGEGAKHLITCSVRNAVDERNAEMMARSVISSSLTKCAVFGCDANWGRILCAMGYSGADFDPDKTDIYFESLAGRIKVCENGRGLDFDEELALKILQCPEVIIDADLSQGDGFAVCWGCDMTYDYVRINGDYRT